MNYKSMGRFISQILLINGALMLPALVLAWYFHESRAAMAFAVTLGLLLALALPLYFATKEAAQAFHQREGLACTGISWLVMSLLGCLPFLISGAIPSFIDAFFETVSGFTTTGATILTRVEDLPRSLLYWRSFTHWIGGMGVLVFLLALAPGGSASSGYTLHLMRAESPGPSVDKLVPRIRESARILYMIYIGLTLLDFLFLLAGKMPLFDAICIAVGTAGTGGFAVTTGGLGDYSPYLQNVTTVFMLLFGINFSCYYLILKGRTKAVLKDEELRVFLLTVLISGLGVTLSVRSLYGSTGEALRHSFFQIASISSTTGFATTDFDRWPGFAKTVLILLTCTGACAGSTCGGIKFSRILLIFKDLRRSVRQMLNPGRVLLVRNNGRPVSERVLKNVGTYLAAYVLILFASFFLLSLDGYDLISGFSAVLACFNNVGPGLGMVGPCGSFAAFSPLSKLVLIFDMLAGRLEIFPMLVLFTRESWGK